MNHKIEIDDDVMDYLKRNAEPFADTPNSVLRRLLLGKPSGVPGDSSSSKATGTKRIAAPPEVPAQPRRRAAVGSLLAEEEYETPLLVTLNRLGGKAAYREVVEEISPVISPMLTDMDKETLPSGGIRWHTRLQFVRLRLIERGLIARDSPRGTWELTAEGKARAEMG